MTSPRTEGRVRALLPGGEGVVGVGWVSAEQQGGQGGGVHDAFHVVDDGQFHPGVGRGGTEALHDVDGFDHRVGGQVVAHAALDAGGQERLQHRDQPVRRRVRRRPARTRSGWRRCPGRRGRPGTTSWPRSSVRPRSRRRWRRSCGRRVRTGAPARPPRFIEENTTLSSSAPNSTRSSRMSAVANTPSTPGSANAARIGRAGRCANSSRSCDSRPRARRGRDGRRPQSSTARPRARSVAGPAPPRRGRPHLDPWRARR